MGAHATIQGRQTVEKIGIGAGTECGEIVQFLHGRWEGFGFVSLRYGGLRGKKSENSNRKTVRE